MAPSKSCRNCADLKYQIVASGMYAVAERCPSCFTFCKSCTDLGYVLSRDKVGRELATPCTCRVVHQKVHLFNQAKVPSQFFDATFKNYQTKAHKSLFNALNAAKFLVRHYSKGDWKGLLYMGGVGVGKTRLVCSIIHAFTLEYNIPCLFQEFTTLLSMIKSQYDQGISESSLLATLSQVEVLVIDELGKGRGSDWEIGILDTLISARYAQKRTTILTTNYTESKSTTYKDHKGLAAVEPEPVILSERVGQRIFSRLQGMCAFEVIDGPDRRVPEL